jgi:hypothetical protein
VPDDNEPEGWVVVALTVAQDRAWAGLDVDVIDAEPAEPVDPPPPPAS